MAAVVADVVSDWDGCIDVIVSSAGVSALPGTPNCPISLAYVGHAREHTRSRLLTSEILEGVDVVLVAQASHVPQVRRLQSTAIVLPIRAAARLAMQMPAVVSQGGKTEMLRDYFTLLADVYAGEDVPKTSLPYGVDDVPDPHVLGVNLHEQSAVFIKSAVNNIASALMTDRCEGSA
jgi:protein-tyrosine-phosphatase